MALLFRLSPASVFDNDEKKKNNDAQQANYGATATVARCGLLSLFDRLKLFADSTVL